ncbi:ABC transporter ATP-binding protein [Alteromonas sp. 5E99-2]|uniref:ABC transporter ATP-binding protein n=1 Tax=Alteromonas sp. 5E99-2 TaxID=2817683 RepID=UPI001A97F3EB|nr:ABC transporter ATP-binding protein [Alteromonas sp. 5E99-2]MBO1255344.1 ABC transporter ATP-binding protein [Alteromonas sp. 5E99-2]
MISVNGLKKVFGKHVAVDALSFSLQPGDIVGFLGPNGAGKSTTMKMLTGFLPATSGTIEIAGKDIVRHRRDIQKQVGYLPEGAPAYGDMTVYQFLVFIARIRGIAKKERQKAIGYVVDKIDLASVVNKKIDTLSKGVVRRVGIAQAIIHDPDILILDEPMDGLDPNQKYQIRNLIKALSKDKIIVISTHLLEDVSVLCNRALIIAEGKLKFDGTPSSLKQLSKSYNSVMLKLSYAADISGLEDIEGVENIEFNHETNQVTLFPEKDKAIVHLIGEYVFQRRLPVDEMTISQGNLDEVFRALTSSEAIHEKNTVTEKSE